MRAVIQRVLSAMVTVDNEVVGQVENGLCVFLGVSKKDTKSNALFLSKKISELRIFCDDNDKMNLSVNDINGDVLVISNFTIFGDCTGGRRPFFETAAAPEKANELYEYFISEIKPKINGKVEKGIFRADMMVDVKNDGPVTIILDTDVLQK